MRAPPLQAIGRARLAILSFAATYALSVVLGIAMVGGGNATALAQRDAIVGAAQTGDTLVAYRANDRLRAALLDFGANLVLGGGTSTVLGVAVIPAYPVAAYRGWVGGIVSVDARHESRLADPGKALYYLVTLVLQLIPYSIAGGVGVHLGVGAWRAMLRPAGDTWLGLPKDRLRDVALAYVVVVPLYLVAALWEFLAPNP
jgi:hypothetical protein